MMQNFAGAPGMNSIELCAQMASQVKASPGLAGLELKFGTFLERGSAHKMMGDEGSRVAGVASLGSFDVALVARCGKKCVDILEARAHKYPIDRIDFDIEAGGNSIRASCKQGANDCTGAEITCKNIPRRTLVPRPW